MRLSEFWKRMDARFGRAYSRSIARDYRLPVLGRTVEQALAEGTPAKDVWRAVCSEFDVPGQLR